jgi:hypothetical protein
VGQFVRGFDFWSYCKNTKLGSVAKSYVAFNWNGEKATNNYMY